ncbi:MAG TPA: CBS domain-containing protein [Methylococcaceae bacterium]|jgi:CBS domain-containing protein|nr:CBS domain-containing protein [Methylococcaceae bacterium]
MSVGQFCNRDTVIVRKQDSIVEAAKLMRQHHVGCLIVVEENGSGTFAPIGIVTDRDLVIEILAEEVNPEEVAIGDIMSYELVTAHENDGLWETLQRMRIKGVRRIPVVDQNGALKGILTNDDLLEILAGELGEIAKLVNRELQREQKIRPPV